MILLKEALLEFERRVREEERSRAVDVLMEMHRKANGDHNYYHFAANEIRGFSVAKDDIPSFLRKREAKEIED